MLRSIVVDPNLATVPPDEVRKAFPDRDIRSPDDIVAALSETDGPTVLVSSNAIWTDAYLDGLSSGDWVTTIGVGYTNFPLQAFSEAGVVFTNCPGISAEQVAEHVFATALSFTRQLWSYRRQQAAHVWQKQRGGMTDLSNDVCCILGLGGIGEAVAERATAFGMSVRGVRRTIEEYDGSADAVYRPEDLTDALSGARLLVIAVPLTEDTRGVIDRTQLDALSDDAIVVNVARGPVLVTEALRSALDDDALRAACLDVTDPEPLPEGHPLWGRDDVLITPHCAGMSEKYPERFLTRFREQFERWRGGETLRHRVV